MPVSLPRLRGQPVLLSRHATGQCGHGLHITVRQRATADCASRPPGIRPVGLELFFLISEYIHTAASLKICTDFI
jgi:hypothetical protein